MSLTREYVFRFLTLLNVKHKVLLKNLAIPLGPCLILFMLLIGCGYTKVVKAPVEISKAAVPKKVAVFPLSDYAQFQRESFVKPYRDPNLLIIEEVTQNLVGYGFNVAIQEDVNKVLVSEEILLPVPAPVASPLPLVLPGVNYLGGQYGAVSNIYEYGFTKDIYGRWDGVSYNPPANPPVIMPTQVAKNDSKFAREVATPGTMEWDYFNNPHLEDVKGIYENEIVEKYRKEFDMDSMDSLSFQSRGVKGLDQETVTTLAQKLDVDIIFRGRILEYGFKDRNTLSPLYGVGLLTFFIDGPKSLIFGVPNKYDTGELIRDTIERMLIGGAVGGGIGAAFSGWETGAMTGAGLGLLTAAGKGLPHKESSVMHIRLYAQDGKTGQILWTNAIEVERTPISRFAFNDKHPKVLLDKLTRKGVKRLVADFIKNTEPSSSQE